MALPEKEGGDRGHPDCVASSRHLAPYSPQRRSADLSKTADTAAAFAMRSCCCCAAGRTSEHRFHFLFCRDHAHSPKFGFHVDAVRRWRIRSSPSRKSRSCLIPEPASLGVPWDRRRPAVLAAHFLSFVVVVVVSQSQSVSRYSRWSLISTA